MIAAILEALLGNPRCPYTRPFDNEPVSTGRALLTAAAVGLPVILLMTMIGLVS